MQVWGGRWRHRGQVPDSLLVPHHAHWRQELHSLDEAQRHPQAVLLLCQDDCHREGEAGHGYMNQYSDGNRGFLQLDLHLILPPEKSTTVETAYKVTDYKVKSRIK